MIVPAITLALALAVIALAFRFACWDMGVRERWGTELARHRLRVKARGPYPVPPSPDAMLEALQTAMAITVRRYSARLDTLTADRFVRDAARAHNMLESALAGSPGGLRVVT